MSVLNDGNNQPGVLIDINAEVSSDYDPSLWGTTESVLVIGTAFDGPSGVATQIYNADMGRYFYGSSYDTKTHRSATLTNGIQAAYDQGCRTIYAMRIGGQDIYKDFRFCEDSNKYMLRVKSATPTNVAKSCYFYLDTRAGNERFVIYKPSSKATIAERKQGYVDSSKGMISIQVLLNEDDGISRNDKISELINTFNKNSRNNVLRLSIVDQDGNDVTTSMETQELRIGSLFSGIYFVGRDRNADSLPAYTTISTRAILNENSQKPYSAYEGNFYRVLDFNSDVAADYPIGSSDYDKMKFLLSAASITAGKNYDFLSTAGVVDRVFLQDNKDYEDVDLSSYEIYEKLGAGYAITAKAIERPGKDANGNDRRPRIIETPSDDDNHTVYLRDGIYPLIQDTEADYRVLVAANANDSIAAKLPNADAFKVSTTHGIQLLGKDGNGALITATSKVAEDDLTAPKAYSFHFKKIDPEDIDKDIIKNTYTDKIAQIVAPLDGDKSIINIDDRVKDAVKKELKKGSVASGTLFMVFEDDTRAIGHLVRVNGKKFYNLDIEGIKGEIFDCDSKLYVGELSNDKVLFVPEKLDTSSAAPSAGGSAGSGAADPATALYKGKKAILIDNGHDVYAATVKGTTNVELEPMGDLTAIMSDSEAKTLVYVEDCYGQTNKIIVTTGAADYIPLDEFVEVLSEDSVLGKLFDFSLTQTGTDYKDMYPEEIETTFASKANGKLDKNLLYFEQKLVDGTTVAGETYTLAADRTIGYDYTKYIPYRTSDNFVRQLAQHCAYASLRTSMTHGIIGYAPLHSFTLKSISGRADELVQQDYSLYAKNGKGRLMLVTEGNPYEIGAWVSVTAFQYPLTDTTSNYTTTVNGAAAYAGMLSTLPAAQSTTMQPITIGSQDFQFSNAQLSDVENAGYVVVKNTTSKGLCIADGVTMAPATELRRRFAIVRTINTIGDLIRTAAEPFIGKTNSLANRSALKTAIDSVMGTVKGQLIWDYSFEIQNMSSYTADSEINISYDVYPMGEIRSVNNQITVRRNASSVS